MEDESVPLLDQVSPPVHEGSNLGVYSEVSAPQRHVLRFQSPEADRGYCFCQASAAREHLLEHACSGNARRFADAPSAIFEQC